MQRGLGGAAFEPVPQSRDREITLGPFMLTFLGCGLFALCGLCFMFGYAVGNRNTEPASASSLPAAVTPAMLSASAQSKPSAGQSDALPQQPSDAVAATQPDDAATGAAPAPASSSQPGNSSDPAARTIPISQTTPAQPVSAGVVQPALAPQPSGIMVQIAAVSQQEDADVLVGALRKRGYAVSAHRDPADGLLHVQVGPFANRNDALAMRQKLLNDGYNAVVQP